jgi:hypothetical protein
VKIVRALVAAAIAFGTAATVQVATAAPASAQQSTDACGNCWHIIINN